MCEVDRVGTESGEREKPTAVVALVVQDGRLLLVRHPVRDADPFWHLPWGRAAREGVPPERVARRVAAEITGLEITGARVVHEQAHPKSGRWMTYVRCKVGEPGADGADRGDGDIEVAWVTRAELPVFMPGSVRRKPPRPVLPDMDAARAEGPAAVLEARWETLALSSAWSHEYHGTVPGLGQVNLIAAARAEPRLAQLYPYTSVMSLCFSACMHFPYQDVAPRVEPLRDGRFRVRVPRSTEVLGTTTTAEEAIALVLRHLPADVGQALDTTAYLLKPR
ncbi:DUF6193 family natural product biosynthesis protein [Uniformispora flossi]|uniref:DUF6193 family natural product biosynthesis protein n=1 Tax=Uniformispora flossi TaxID=3390723 RepID=UPI003C2FEC59